jgi:PAS domain S-box-containing protein
MTEPVPNNASRPSQPAPVAPVPAELPAATLPIGMLAGFDLVPGHIAMADAQGLILYINPHGLKLTGYQASELVGRPLTTLWDQAPEASEKILAHLAQHRFWHGELKQRHKEGPGHWEMASLALAPCASTGQTLIVQSGQHLDAAKQSEIDQLKKERQALEEKARRYRTILDASPDPICLTRLEDGKYVDVNTAFFERTGFTPEQIAKYTSIELNVYTGPGERNRLISRLKRDGRVENMEMTIRSKSGTIVSDLWSLRIIEYEGEPHLLLMARNYSQLRAAQQALMESEARYRNILRDMEEGYWEMDLRGTFTFVNEAECRIHRRTAEEMIGKRSRGFYSPDTDVRVSALFNQVYRTGIPAPMLDIEINRGDGSSATIESSASLLKDATGAPVGFFGITRDISEKRKAEKELEQYRKQLEQMVQERTKALEAAQGELVKREKLSTLGQLTSTVSHELRNPLGVIRSSNFYLQRRLETRDDKIDKHFKRIEEQVALCDSIVNDLLEYTQGRSVSVDKAPIHLWLEKLIEEIEATRSITIECRLPVDLPPISHDQEKMRRVFIKLIENAIQAIRDRDEANPKPRAPYQPQVRVTARQEANQLVMQVADNGVGMDEKTRSRAFEPLFTTRARGTGIGLAIVQKIVNEHRGNVSIQSEPDHGTTVTITLPY